ncbi:hypothetical protein CLV78_101979 [Aliiruegeria haliotis]|uniref:Uncharacterized protein n=1 Tax=Aliiruegeria haliotis TaxID=1280846 RepID=A0A2T0S0D7_9RHOB|nr:hypothetical protein [Aliiruegeria haliotis]PRY26875.1 hypothetical protein CLV78_101979 [Aliiruegeria haliotis]
MQRKPLPLAAMAIGSLALMGCEYPTDPVFPSGAPVAPTATTTVETVDTATLPDAGQAGRLTAEEIETGEEGEMITLTGPGEEVPPPAPLHDPGQNCLMATAAQSGASESELTKVSTAAGSTGTTVMVKVPGSTLPWQCTTDARGVIVNVAPME